VVSLLPSLAPTFLQMHFGGAPASAIATVVFVFLLSLFFAPLAAAPIALAFVVRIALG
jgi:hypothetical protein